MDAPWCIKNTNVRKGIKATIRFRNALQYIFSAPFSTKKKKMYEKHRVRSINV